MPASNEFKAAKTMAKLLDARSFDPEHFAAAMYMESPEIQKAYFNTFMAMFHMWSRNTEVGPHDPMFAVYQYARRFAEDMPGKVD